MSVLESLTIRGIRSFGIDKEDEQKIEFSSPVTLIVGENGCGKTTIIECLKYALTGKTPPGSENGKNFVQDVSLSNVSCALGQVRLKVSDSRDASKTICRSMRIDRNAKTGKSKFETLESVITYQAPGKKLEDISGRNADINAIMCSTMGVSEAVLNNVIFCHQEDSNWPLDGPKELKKKFDEIFETDIYDAGLKKLVKQQKDYQDKLKDVVKDKVHNAKNRDIAINKEKDLKAHLKEYEKSKSKCDALKQQLDDLDGKMKLMQEKEKEYGKYIAEKESYERKIVDRKRECENLSTKIKSKLNGTLEELEHQLISFTEDEAVKRNKLKELEKKIKQLTEEEQERQKSYNELVIKANKLSDEIQRLQDRSGDRFEKVRNICELLKIPFDYEDEQSINTSEYSEIFKNIEKAISKESKNLDRLKLDANEKDQTFQTNIDELRIERTKLETNMSSHRQSIKAIAENRKKISAKISESEKSAPMLDQLKIKISSAENKLKNLNDASKLENLKKQQEEIELEVYQIEETMTQIESNIEVLQSFSKISNELELKENDLTKE